MNSIRYSVIVPVYNVESYLHRCIDSILEQDYYNLECILVDDGSIDGSGEIAEEYARSDPRVKVIHKENGGLSSARNAGMAIATGEWIMHVDGDDFLEKNALSVIQKYIGNNDVGIISFEYSTDYPSGKKVAHHVDRDKYYGIVDRETAIGQVLDGCSFAVCRAYKTEIAHRSAFKENIRRGADTVYLLEVLDSIEEILSVPDIIYHYVQSEGSLARSKITPMQLTVLDSSKLIYDFISEKYPMYLALTLDHYVNTRVNLYYKMFISAYADKEFSDEMIQDTHDKYRLLKETGKISVKKKLKYGLFDWNPELYCRVFRFAVNHVCGEKYSMYKTS